MAGHAPYLLGVGLKEREVKLATEAVDEEVLKGTFLAPRQERGTHITETATKGPDQTQLAQSTRSESDGIVEEAVQKVDPALALAHQQHQIFLFRVVKSCRAGNVALAPVVGKPAGRTGAVFDRHHAKPPLHHAARFREKAVAANIHAVALVAHRPRDAADLLAGFKNNGFDCGTLLELDGRSQPCGTCSDDDRRALVHRGPDEKPLKNRSRNRELLTNVRKQHCEYIKGASAEADLASAAIEAIIKMEGT